MKHSHSFALSALFLLCCSTEPALGRSQTRQRHDRVLAAAESVVQDVWQYVQSDSNKHKIPNQIAACGDSIPNATLALPTAGAVEVVPGDIVEAIALGLGFQTYTCTNNNWALSEVNATLYDISCQYNSTSISAISTAFNGLAANAISKLGSANFKHSASTLSGIAGRLLRRLGSLSTLDNTTYTFDFRTTAGGPLVNTSAFASGPIYATQSAPIPSYNVPWLRITTSNGSLAKEVFQVQTAGGYPLTMGLGCTEGSTDSVTFSAQYWFYKENVAASSSAAKAASCTVDTTVAKNEMVILTQSVQYGQTGDLCTSITDCTTKCMAESECVGFSLSTQDGQGYLKTQILEASMIYSPVFTAGIVRSITNKQYVDRTGAIDDCPSGQITAADFLGCVVPTC